MSDPKVAFWSTMEGMTGGEQRARRNDIARLDKGYAPYFASKHVDQWPGCPYHAAMRLIVPGSLGEEKKL